MKIDLSHTERAYLANLMRRRSMELDERARLSTVSAQKQELQEEALFTETLAIRLDDGEEIQTEAKVRPIVANPRLDLDAIDAPSIARS